MKVYSDSEITADLICHYITTGLLTPFCMQIDHVGKLAIYGVNLYSD